jgi:membrane protease YdiL (CAAX protease family)
VNPLEEAIRRLPVGVEFLVVVTWAFGLPVFASIMALGTPGDSSSAVFNNAELLATIIFEVVQLGFLTWFLRIRGWTLEKFGLSFSWRGTVAGVVLLAITYGLAVGAEYIAQIVFDYDLEAAAARAPKVDPALSMQLVFLVSVVNGIFEELFVAGYIITALVARRGMWMAINVSVVVRLLYHLYQGPIGIMTVVPMGLLYGYVYSRTRQLWPLMVAHVILDVVGLVMAM